MKHRVCIHLGHLETNDLGEGTFLRGDFSVVHAKDAGAGGITTIILNPFITELGLILSEGDTSNFTAIVLVCKSSEGAPSTSDIEQAIVGLEVEFLANDGQLVILELLEALFFFDIQNDARGINHARTKEPFVKVVTT